MRSEGNIYKRAKKESRITKVFVCIKASKVFQPTPLGSVKPMSPQAVSLAESNARKSTIATDDCGQLAACHAASVGKLQTRLNAWAETSREAKNHCI